MRRLLAAVALSTLVTMPVLACGFDTKGTGTQPIPSLAALLDDQMPTAKLPDAEVQQVKVLRAKIATLAAENKMQQAREVEEKAMKILGYRKMWLRCEPGTFLWMRLAPKTSEFVTSDR